MQWDTINCSKVAQQVVANWSQSDMVAICENYLFEQLQDSEEYFDTVVGNIKREKDKKK